VNIPSEKQKPIDVDSLDLDSLPCRSMTRLRVALVTNGIGDSIRIPVIVVKGIEENPIVGITAAVHGDELNGLPIIFGFINDLNPWNLRGTVIAVPVVNTQGFLLNSRYMGDGVDLNRVFPGKKKGTSGDIYAYSFMHRVVNRFQYLIDLHTASFGRINSLYVKADLASEETCRMAYLQNPQIIVNSTGKDGTLRSAASERGIHSITVEVGNPLRFQKKLIKSSLSGIRNVMSHLKMIPRPVKSLSEKPIICKKSYWMYSDRGGILEVLPDLVAYVKKDEVAARLRNVYGDIICEYKIKEEIGVVIGKNINPVGNAGARILHLGIPAD
jgi:predicted deacylase